MIHCIGEEEVPVEEAAVTGTQIPPGESHLGAIKWWNHGYCDN